MGVHLNDHARTDAKYDKVNSSCIKNVRIVEDDENRKREIGEIDFCKMTKQDLVQVFNCINDVVIGSDLRCLSDVLINKNVDKELYNYMDLIEDKMGEKGLFNLLKEYLTRNENNDKHKAFVQLLNTTCRLVYTDCDNYIYESYDEHPHPTQNDIDHNMVGDYSLVLTRPIPFKIIKTMANRVTRLRETENSNFDKKHSTAELDELNNCL